MWTLSGHSRRAISLNLPLKGIINSLQYSNVSFKPTPIPNMNSTNKLPHDGLLLKDFIKNEINTIEKNTNDDTADNVNSSSSFILSHVLGCSEQQEGSSQRLKTIALETYGCQMNVSDTELVRSILIKEGFNVVSSSPSQSLSNEVDGVLLMTCAIREHAENRIFERLDALRAFAASAEPKRRLMLGVLGCMAERLKGALVSGPKGADVVCGPDAYRDLPRLLRLSSATSSPMMNVQLSLEETYAEIRPVRADPSEHSAYVSIMRGCDNMCSYCIVPFTRGRERSRPMDSIIDEVSDLVNEQSIKVITLLGQNVNSYCDKSTPSSIPPGIMRPLIGHMVPHLYRTIY